MRDEEAGLGPRQGQGPDAPEGLGGVVGRPGRQQGGHGGGAWPKEQAAAGDWASLVLLRELLRHSPLKPAQACVPTLPGSPLGS